MVCKVKKTGLYKTFNRTVQELWSLAGSNRVSSGLGSLTGYLIASIAGSVLFTGRAAAQAEARRCSGPTSESVESLLVLLDDLQLLGVEFGLPFAGLVYTYSGLLWMTGRSDLQRKSRGYFAGATVGLIIIILADGFVAIVAEALCGVVS